MFRELLTEDVTSGVPSLNLRGYLGTVIASKLITSLQASIDCWSPRRPLSGRRYSSQWAKLESKFFLAFFFRKIMMDTIPLDMNVRSADADTLGLVVCLLIAQLGSQNIVLKGTAYMQVRRLHFSAMIWTEWFRSASVPSEAPRSVNVCSGISVFPHDRTSPGISDLFAAQSAGGVMSFPVHLAERLPFR